MTSNTVDLTPSKLGMERSFPKPGKDICNLRTDADMLNVTD